MAAFDPVTAFVAFVSFIVGYVSGRLLKKDDPSPHFGHAHGGHSKPYVRLRDRESSGEAGTQTNEVVAEKKSKFDALFSEYSGGRRGTGQYGGYSPEEQETPKSRGREHRSIAPAQRKDPHYVEIPEARQEELPAPGKPPARPKNKEQKEEWTPMGFFED